MGPRLRQGLGCEVLVTWKGNEEEWGSVVHLDSSLGFSPWAGRCCFRPISLLTQWLL